VLIDEELYLEHYGTPRKSGRYPWGSGGDEPGKVSPTRNKDFTDYYNDMKSQGLSEKEIAEGIGYTVQQLRQRKSIARNEKRQSDIDMAVRLHEKGYSNGAIAERMGLAGESSARSLIAASQKEERDILKTTSEMLKAEVAEKTIVDIGAGTENLVGITKTRLGTAVAMLQDQGYTVHKFDEEQAGTGLMTKYKVLCPPGMTQKEAWARRGETRIIGHVSDDGGRTNYGLLPPLSIHPDRVGIVYKEDGGDKSDGVIFVRPGVKDVNLDKALYAQVRVKVGEDRYLKGMAMYKDDLPPGIDLQFNTNKSKDTSKRDVMKPTTDDPNNPFGSSLKRQIIKKDANGKPLLDKNGHEQLESAMNLVHEEGDWANWSKTISTQMLSKQSPTLARNQLNMTYEQRLKDFKDISSLTNPTIKKNLLEKFADGTDSAAVHLDAAGLKDQGWHSILPISTMKPTEVYAPNYNNGDRVVLIRFPHGGTFEIPELTVNNNHKEAKGLIGGARDAVGIHHSVAERLSGADFDGDTVLVIPNMSKRIKTSPGLEGLKNFDPKSAFPKYEGMPVMTPRQKGMEMGNISNLITDMTIHGAPNEHIARAVRHSMVVIDAEKHELNYKESARVNNIAELKERYQGSKRAGASTLISRATAQEMVPERRLARVSEGGPINKATGEINYVPTNRINYRTGAPKKVRSTKLGETKDAHTLVSGTTGTTMERIYADHSNKLKDLANLARKEAVNTPRAKKNPSATKVYAKEVESLNAKLHIAQRNAPLERQAQIIAQATYRARRDEKPLMDEAEKKKIKFQALEQARARTGAQKSQVKFTPDEWEAIQAGAISDTKLETILKHADIDSVRQMATPKPGKLMTSAKTKRAEDMIALGYTRKQIADALGVSITTLDEATTGSE